MRKVILITLLLLFYSHAEAVKEWAMEFPSGTPLEVYSPNNPPPGGSGDVTDVGDCTGGACFDGTSDGGTYVDFYDAQGRTRLIGGNTTGEVNITLPNTTGTLIHTEIDPTVDTSGEIVAIIGAGVYEPAGITESDISDLQAYLTAEVDGSTTNEINTLTLPDANVTAGLGITFAQSGPIAITESAPDTVLFTVTEADPLSATKALNNLTSVAINTSLLSDAADTDDLGSTSKEWANLYLGDAGKIYLGLGQDTSINRSAANTMTLTASDKVITSSDLLINGDLVLNDEASDILLWDSGTNVGWFLHSSDTTESSGYGEFQLWRATGTIASPTIGDKPPAWYVGSDLIPRFPSGLVGNLTGNVTGNLTGNATTATTATTATNVVDADYGEIGVSSGVWSVENAAVIGKLITGFSSGAGALAGTDTLLQAINKLDGNVGTKGTKAGDTWTGTHDFGGATLEIPNGADMTTATGQIAVNTTHKGFVWHDGTQEVFQPSIHTLQGSLGTGDYDTDPDVKILELDSAVFPHGIVITAWEVKCNEADPTTELAGDLKYCDDNTTGAFPGANAVLIDVLDTTTGNSSEATMSNSDLGSGVIPAGKIIYILLDSDLVSDTTLFFVKITYYIPES